MRKRVEMAGDKGCDGVDPDNVDGYVSILLSLCKAYNLLGRKALTDNSLRAKN
jgi:hypothetical protein